MSPRDALHRLVDDLPEKELPTAARVLEALRRPHSTGDAPAVMDRHSNGLARFAGTWTAQDLEEFEAAIAPMEQIDEELWR
jgi:hypothetical protein